jgi:hypothetical protein
LGFRQYVRKRGVRSLYLLLAKVQSFTGPKFNFKYLQWAAMPAAAPVAAAAAPVAAAAALVLLLLLEELEKTSGPILAQCSAAKAVDHKVFKILKFLI